jgi:hypothetical protein
MAVPGPENERRIATKSQSLTTARSNVGFLLEAAMPHPILQMLHDDMAPFLL